jgi:hypothetical protein
MPPFFSAPGRCFPPLFVIVVLAVSLPAGAQRNGAMKVSMTVLPSCEVSADNRSSRAMAGEARVVCAARYPFHASLRLINDDGSGVAADTEAGALSGSGRMELPQVAPGRPTVMRLTVAY